MVMANKIMTQIILEIAQAISYLIVPLLFYIQYRIRREIQISLQEQEYMNIKLKKLGKLIPSLHSMSGR